MKSIEMQMICAKKEDSAKLRRQEEVHPSRTVQHATNLAIINHGGREEEEEKNCPVWRDKSWSATYAKRKSVCVIIKRGKKRG